MDSREWIKVLDRYILEGTMSPDEYERLDYEQMYTIQEIKKHNKRVKNDKELFNLQESTK